ncbi:MAG: hypothetical protein C0462_03685 [Alcanivorax sp.]|nr:hypothetical protein [Alcanivorax sp.]
MYRQERGAALLMSLVLLVVMTLIGVAAMRSTTMQERMAGGMQDQTIALQAAESALRAGEMQLRENTVLNFNQNGWYDFDDGRPRPTWLAAPTDTNSSRALVYDGDLMSRQAPLTRPQYYIERLLPVEAEETAGGSLALGDGQPLEEVDLYRVRARGFGRNTNTVVILESVFRR